MPALPDTLRLAVICMDLPSHCDGRPNYLAVQQGREVAEITPAGQGKADFLLEFRLGQRGDAPNFLGPYAQGSAAERFFYLSWGTGQTPATFGMFRRLKVHLSHLTWDDIKAATQRDEPLRVKISMTDRRGGPLCASVRQGDPAVSWQLT